MVVKNTFKFEELFNGLFLRACQQRACRWRDVDMDLIKMSKKGSGEGADGCSRV